MKNEKSDNDKLINKDQSSQLLQPEAGPFNKAMLTEALKTINFFLDEEDRQQILKAQPLALNMRKFAETCEAIYHSFHIKKKANKLEHLKLGNGNLVFGN